MFARLLVYPTNTDTVENEVISEEEKEEEDEEDEEAEVESDMAVERSNDVLHTSPKGRQCQFTLECCYNM